MNKGEIVKVKRELEREKVNLRSEIEDKFNDLRDETTNLVDTRISNQTVTYANSTMGKSMNEVSFLISKDTKLRFYGKVQQGTNPKQFLKHAKVALDQLNNSDHVKSALNSMLKGSAEEWFGIIQNKFQTFAEFEKLFIARFWDDETQEQVREKLEKRSKNYLTKINCKIKKKHVFKIGDLVIIKSLRVGLRSKDQCQKLQLPFEGPYLVSERNENSYLLRYPETNKIRGKFHLDMIYTYDQEDVDV